MKYDLTIPVWGVIVFIGPFIVGGLWVLIKMFFWQKSANLRFRALELRIEENERENKRVDDKLTSMLEKQIETQTLVKLLVEERRK